MHLVPCLLCSSLPSVPKPFLSHATRALVPRLAALQLCRSETISGRPASRRQPERVNCERSQVLVWPAHFEASQLMKYMGAFHHEMWKMLMLLLTQILEMSVWCDTLIDNNWCVIIDKVLLCWVLCVQMHLYFWKFPFSRSLQKCHLRLLLFFLILFSIFGINLAGVCFDGQKS